jgi:hypothetical protein
MAGKILFIEGLIGIIVSLIFLFFSALPFSFEITVFIVYVCGAPALLYTIMKRNLKNIGTLLLFLSFDKRVSWLISFSEDYGSVSASGDDVFGDL